MTLKVYFYSNSSLRNLTKEVHKTQKEKAPFSRQGVQVSVSTRTYAYARVYIIEPVQDKETHLVQ